MNKRCPRCKTKAPYATVVCPECKLNYQKFEQATNKEAKKNIRAGEKEQVLMRNSRPSDVVWWKLLLMAIFLGWVGGHHYYVGRNKMGLFYTLTFVLYLTIFFIIKLVVTQFIFDVYSVLMLTWGFVVFMWIVDVAKICLNKFKIPVSRELE